MVAEAGNSAGVTLSPIPDVRDVVESFRHPAQVATDHPPDDRVAEALHQALSSRLCRSSGSKKKQLPPPAILDVLVKVLLF